MRKLIFISSLVILLAVACDKEHIEKPDHLIKEKKMIEMLVDVHMAEAAYHVMRDDSFVINSSTENFYYSVLEKHGIQDSVFEKSLIYYAGQPKRFEKMYREVMTQLSTAEQEFSGRKNDLLEFEGQELPER